MHISGQIRIRRLGENDIPRWDAFVENAPEATFFHRAGWKQVLEEAFGHSAYFLYAESQTGEILGVLPLGHIRSRLFGDALISTPFCVYGGSVGVSEHVCFLLDAEACRLAESLGVGQLELRYTSRRHCDWPYKDLYVTFRKSIDPDPEKNLLAIPRKQRAMVRKGIQLGLESYLDVDIDVVHRIYSESVRNLGTPVFSKQYFRVLKKVFGKDCEVLTVLHNGRIVSAVISFMFRDEVLPYYGGGVADARALKANDFMYWEVMRRACERQVQMFDFGRSKVGTGAFNFKRNWGFEPIALSYEFHLVKAKDLPDINPLNPKYRLFISGWKHLPLPISRMIGPFLSRSLG